MTIKDLFTLGRTDWISLLSEELSRVFSNTTVQKHQFFSALIFYLFVCFPNPSPVSWSSDNTCLPANISMYLRVAITSWEIDGETVETVADFILGSSKITADGDCSHEIKRHLLLGRKVMTNLDSILKSRDITLPTKVRLVKYMVYPVVMYGCESWTVKKAES